jgi:hypothetical protein
MYGENLYDFRGGSPYIQRGGGPAATEFALTASPAVRQPPLRVSWMR